MSHSIVFHNETYVPINKDLIKLYAFKGIEFYVKNTQIKVITLTEGALLHAPHTVFLKKKNYPEFLKQLFELNKGSSSSAKNMSLHMEALLNSFENFGASPSNMYFLNEVVKEIVDMDSKSGFKEMISLLISENSVNKTLFTAFYTRLIANTLGWSAPTILQKIVLSSFISALNEESLYILKKNNSFPEEIFDIVSHCNENQNGSGPLKIKRTYIHPISKLIRVSNEFYPYFTHKKIENGIIHLKSITPTLLNSATVQAAVKIFQK
jgi:hypothetical protein